MDDRALLDRLKSGDQAAFDSMFRDHYPHLVTFGQSLLRDRAAAEDIAQEVMLELWRRREDIVIQESLRAYLLRATRNRSLNQLRHANVARRAEPQLVGEGIDLGRWRVEARRRRVARRAHRGGGRASARLSRSISS